MMVGGGQRGRFCAKLLPDVLYSLALTLCTIAVVVWYLSPRAKRSRVMQSGLWDLYSHGQMGTLSMILRVD
jgi:hypothetical protein